jgi:hypothetical protein
MYAWRANDAIGWVMLSAGSLDLLQANAASVAPVNPYACPVPAPTESLAFEGPCELAGPATTVRAVTYLKKNPKLRLACGQVFRDKASQTPFLLCCITVTQKGHAGRSKNDVKLISWPLGKLDAPLALQSVSAVDELLTEPKPSAAETARANELIDKYLLLERTQLPFVGRASTAPASAAAAVSSVPAPALRSSPSVDDVLRRLREEHQREMKQQKDQHEKELKALKKQLSSTVSKFEAATAALTATAAASSARPEPEHVSRRRSRSRSRSRGRGHSPQPREQERGRSPHRRRDLERERDRARSPYREHERDERDRDYERDRSRDDVHDRERRDFERGRARSRSPSRPFIKTERVRFFVVVRSRLSLRRLVLYVCVLQVAHLVTGWRCISVFVCWSAVRVSQVDLSSRAVHQSSVVLCDQCAAAGHADCEDCLQAALAVKRVLAKRSSSGRG